MKNRLTNYNFWISMFSAVLLILQALKIEFDIAYVNEIFTAVLGLLVVVGIIIDPTKTAEKTQTKKEEKQVDETVEAKNNLPNFKENETNNINNENDFQTVLEKIATKLETKIKEMNEINKDAAKTILALQQERSIEEVLPEVKELLSKEEIVNIEVETKGENSPAVAEMENPYFNLNN